MKKFVLSLGIIVLIFAKAVAQMPNGKFGNEWIRYDQPYFKILVAQDGMYRISFQTLATRGVDVNALSRVQLYCWGEQVPLYIGDDYIEFFGRKNRSELDRFLYPGGEADMLNPEYSLITDTSAYFLTIAANDDVPAKRFTAAENDLTNLPLREPWFWWEEQRIYTNGVVQRASGDLSESAFDQGEGYAVSFDLNKPFDTRLYPAHRADAALNNRLDIRLAGIGANPHAMTVSANGQVLKTDEFGGHLMRNYALELSDSNPADTVRLRIEDTRGRFAVASVQLKYPRYFNFDNKNSFLFKIAASAEAKYLEIENFNAGNAAPVLYDLTNQLRLVTVVEGGKVKFKLPPSENERELILINNQLGITNVNVPAPFTFVDFSDANVEYIIITSKQLRDAGSGVQEYADYRASAAGGNYRTIVVNVEDLYDQFSYGIHRHPLAIRNFGHFAVKNWENPRYVFLLGKGQAYPSIRSKNALDIRVNAGVAHVPTFGAPGSDNLLMASIETQTPVIPTGRLAATTDEEIRMYLEKVRDYENPLSNDDVNRAWRKQVLHMGGGGDVGEQTQIRNYLNQMKSMLEGNDFGASVTSFFKTSTDPIQQTQTTSLLERINKGVSIITYFGHSSPTGFDFTLDDPANYDNIGRYMTIFSLGCQTGDYFLFNASNRTEKSVTEQFVFQENRGAIAFLGSSERGSIFPLYTFQRSFYDLLGGNLYGQGVGNIVQSVIQRLDNASYSSISYRALLQQFALHGDPALVILPYGQPDYLIEQGSVQFFPNVINAQQDSFTLQFNVLNIGRAVQDSLTIEISRAFPDGIEYIAAEIRVPAPRFRQEVSLNLPLFGERSTGFNKIFIRLNADEKIEELPIPEAKTNNELRDAISGRGADFYVFSNTVEPVYPPAFSIVNKVPLQLAASTSNSTAPFQKFLIEIDTTANFNSPFKRRQALEQSGGLIQWQPEITWNDSTVYYWRISPDSTEQFGYLWNSSSFVYIKDSPSGWSQSHLFQFAQNQLINMQLPETTRRWKFIDNVKEVKIGNTTYTGSFLPYAEIDGSVYIYQAYSNRINGGLYIYVLDGATGESWGNGPPGKFGSQIEWGTTAFPFNTQIPEKRAAAVRFLQDTIPSGNYVVMFTLQRGSATYEPEEWAADTDNLGTNLFEVLEKQGATRIRETATTGARPYIFIYKKDDPSFQPIEILADSINQIIEGTYQIYGNWFTGAVRSGIIGNARNWSRLQWDVVPNDTYDKFGVDVYGIKSDSSSVLLLENVADLDVDISEISATEFPMLRLNFRAEDAQNRTAPQLQYWRVLYEGLPDAALAPNLFFQMSQDTLQQGEVLRLSIAVANPSNYDLDSLLMKFTLLKDGVTIRQESLRLKPILNQDTLVVAWALDTRPLSGAYRMVVEANPDNDQPEQYRFNNSGIFEFFVEKDRRNPLLDVTFDGIRIMDGDLVSAKPQIIIALQDDNRYLPLDAPGLFSLFLESPNPDDPLNPIQTPVSLESEEIQFYPAQTGDKKNKATLEWTPEFTASGSYALRIQARDATGNAAGNVDLKIRFEVITETLISNILNYPNPFSSSTRFVYTLTGSEAPAYFTIQIMTVSGRIVRELTQDDLGPLRIGTHQTEFAWDGTDQYGDRLANGVYLYRLIAKDRNGNDIGKYDNGTSVFFKNNFGKLVILR